MQEVLPINPATLTATTSATTLLTKFQSLQNNFNGTVLETYLGERAEIPVAIVGLYFLLVFYVPQLMESRKPMNLKLPFKAWNFLLAVFSILGAFYTIPVLLSKLFTHGWRYTICQRPNDDYYHDGAVGFWAAAFILSKIPELMDTVFLVLQKKPVIFLHWFHHCTVLLYCWHAYTVGRIGAGLWFAGMNYGVHAIMYSYYFLMCFQVTRKIVRPFAVYITSLQIVQMVMGMIVILASAYYFNPADPNSCAVNQSNMRMGFMMYASYFVLFASLFNKLYLKKKKEQQKQSSTTGGEIQTKTEAEDEETSLCKTTTVDAHDQLIGAPEHDTTKNKDE